MMSQQTHQHAAQIASLLTGLGPPRCLGTVFCGWKSECLFTLSAHFELTLFP